MESKASDDLTRILTRMEGNLEKLQEGEGRLNIKIDTMGEKIEETRDIVMLISKDYITREEVEKKYVTIKEHNSLKEKVDEMESDKTWIVRLVVGAVIILVLGVAGVAG